MISLLLPQLELIFLLHSIIFWSISLFSFSLCLPLSFAEGDRMKNDGQDTERTQERQSAKSNFLSKSVCQLQSAEGQVDNKSLTLNRQVALWLILSSSSQGVQKAEAKSWSFSLLQNAKKDFKNERNRNLFSLIREKKNIFKY